MHDTAKELGDRFFTAYWHPSFSTILEIGSMNVNGTLRDVAPEGAQYTGVDLEAGPGVDLIASTEERLPFADSSFDAVLASSVLEHDEFFWQTFLELARVTRTGGFIYLNVPSNGPVHRHPVDNWRFYPDAGSALAKWASRSGRRRTTLVESFIENRKADVWNDFVAVFRVGDRLEDRQKPAMMFDAATGRSPRFERSTDNAVQFESPEDVEIQNRLLGELAQERADHAATKSHLTEATTAIEQLRADQIQCALEASLALADKNRHLDRVVSAAAAEADRVQSESVLLKASVNNLEQANRELAEKVRAGLEALDATSERSRKSEKIARTLQIQLYESERKSVENAQRLLKLFEDSEARATTAVARADDFKRLLEIAFDQQISLSTRLELETHALREAAQKLASAERSVAAIHSSTFWKATQPLRAIADAVKRVFND